MKIYMGVWNIQQATVLRQFMYSVRRLKKRISAMPFRGLDWILDSGGFSEININGKYSFTVNEYLRLVELHQPRMFFNMDYVCESNALNKTGLTIKQHQEKTTNNQIKIMDIYNKFNIKGQFAGCIQGFEIEEYLSHIDSLKEHGLITPIMGIGSICRRNSINQILNIIKAIKKEVPKTKLHGFGIKTQILNMPSVYNDLYSCDSMSWSLSGRNQKTKMCINCKYPNSKSCGNCHYYLINYYNKINNLSNTIQENFIEQKYSMFDF